MACPSAGSAGIPANSQRGINKKDQKGEWSVTQETYQLTEEERSRLRGEMREIAGYLNDCPDYEDVYLPADYNTIPYGTPASCKSKLVAFVDGKYPIAEVLARTLLHVGQHCRGVTRAVLFQVSIPKGQWDALWELFGPAFIELDRLIGVVFEINFNASQRQTVFGPGTSFGTHGVARRQIIDRTMQNMALIFEDVSLVIQTVEEGMKNAAFKALGDAATVWETSTAFNGPNGWLFRYFARAYIREDQPMKVVGFCIHLGQYRKQDWEKLEAHSLVLPMVNVSVLDLQQAPSPAQRIPIYNILWELDGT